VRFKEKQLRFRPAAPALRRNAPSSRASNCATHGGKRPGYGRKP
jgi:hypothetical protein